MLDGKATDALEASSLGFQLQYVDVFSNCWGPKDDGKTFGKPGPLAAKALKRGAEAVRYVNYFLFKVKPGVIFLVLCHFMVVLSSLEIILGGTRPQYEFFSLVLNYLNIDGNMKIVVY